MKEILDQYVCIFDVPQDCTLKDRNRHDNRSWHYIKKPLAYTFRQNLYMDIQNISANIYLPEARPALVDAIYRPTKYSCF